jgi:hypothetical protein
MQLYMELNNLLNRRFKHIRNERDEDIYYCIRLIINEIQDQLKDHLIKLNKRGIK